MKEIVSKNLFFFSVEQNRSVVAIVIIAWLSLKICHSIVLLRALGLAYLWKVFKNPNQIRQTS